MPRNLHIAIIDTDVPVPTVYAARGLYSSQFRVLLQAAAARLNKSQVLLNGPVILHATAWDAVGESLPPLECLRTSPSPSTSSTTTREYTYTPKKDKPIDPIDAILITGSSASAYEIHKYPWIPALQAFIQKVYADYPEVKIFGSCFGHQIVAQALLSISNFDIKSSDEALLKVDACPFGYEVGIHPIRLNPGFTCYFPGLLEAYSRLDGHSVNNNNEKKKRKEDFRIQLVHGDRVVPVSTNNTNNNVLLPPPWINLGSTPLCPIQGLYRPHRILTYQGHFEFDTFVNRETCLEFARRGNWEGSFVEDCLVRIESAATVHEEDDDDDSKLAAEMVVMFFVGEDDGVHRTKGVE